MDFEHNIPEWENNGTEPNEELRKNGFQAGYKPPAGVFNWFWSKFIACINELQTKLKGHAGNESNPHKVTAEQSGAAKIDLTNVGNDVFKNKAESAGIVVDVYNKDETCADQTLDLFNCETPNNIFEQIGGHWWKRRIEESGIYTRETIEKKPKIAFTTSGLTVYYADSYEAKDGVFTLVNPSSASLDLTSNSMNNVQALIRGKYFMLRLSKGAEMYRGYYDDTKFTSITVESGDLTIYYVTGYTASAEPYTTIGEYEYVHSTERNKYPDSGMDGNFAYSYLGIPFANARETINIAIGSYKGTDTFGANNPNIIPCEFTPKIIILVCKHGKSPDGFVDDDYKNINNSLAFWTLTDEFKQFRDWQNNYDGYGRRNGNAYEWYSRTAALQYNESNYTYEYIILG